MSQTGHICVPPLFLDSPGKPCMKWKGWLRAFENYIVSIDGQGYSPERKKSLLFGLLGKAGQEVFDSLPVYVNPHGATAPLNEYQEAVRRLELQYAEEKLGHFAAVCKAKKYSTGMKVSSVSESDTDADADIVLSIDGEDGRVKGPIGSVMIGAIKLPFTADSGSPLTLISDRTFDLKWQDVRLHETDVSPKAFGEHDIVMKGYFWDSLTFRGRTVRTKIYVAEKGRSLVGWKDLAKLGVMLVPGAEDPIVLRDDWVNYVQPDDLHEGLAEVLEIFDSVLENKVGCVRGFVHAIRLKKGALPIKHKVRTIPLSVRGELKAVLDKLKMEGVIEEAGASEWVSAIVVSKKKRTGDIRLGRRCMSELTPKFNKWYDMKEEIEAGSDERLRVKARIMAKQESNKRYADIVNRAKTKNIAQGDWVLVKKPNRVMKGESVFQTPVRVQGVTRGAVCLEGVGWRSKDDIVRLKAGQEEIIMKGGRVDGAECTDDVDEWQSHEARDVVIDEEECANTPSRRGRIGHGSAERCEKAWRGLMDAEGQNGCRPESEESDSHNVMGSGREDACAVRANSLQGDVVRELTYETGRERIGPSSMFGRLTTSRPIRIEDGRDVRGRRGRDGERANKRGVARWPAPRGPCFLRQDNKRYYNATRLPRILHTCHYCYPKE
ncbi:hypothetical protein NDU88_000468 [Pleurodeles waltl]|uniref:Uncharacterized protein n=1 Tax=Pleurodeles waltl TaxID=8319 RepID=A0AAV7TF37_PLEWA|nr:hypothetical protein NDU88_000468 [Pleurodeles waltl]